MIYSNPFDNYSEEEMFTFEIWELKLMINVGEIHLQNFKQDAKLFKEQGVRQKGADTVFYELNIPEWKQRLDISLKQFVKYYGKEYDERSVRFPTK